MGISLYDYQNELYVRSQNSFREGKRRVLIVAPCG